MSVSWLPNEWFSNDCGIALGFTDGIPQHEALKYQSRSMFFVSQNTKAILLLFLPYLCSPLNSGVLTVTV